MVEIGHRVLVLFLVVVFGTLFPVIFLIDWADENVVNPRIWDDWTCDMMREYAMAFKDEELNNFQRAQFHSDLSRCLGS